MNGFDANTTGTGSIDGTVRSMERLTAVCVLISSLEYLSRPKQFKDTGLLTWDASSVHYEDAAWNRFAARAIAPFAAYPGILMIIALRGLCALALIVLPLSRRQRCAMTAFLAVSSKGLQVRSSYGLDGSDAMSELVLAATTVEGLFQNSPRIRQASIWFVALQSCLSYCTAGVAKMASPIWRTEKAMLGIFRTNTYGIPRVYEVLAARPRMTKWISLAGVLWECAFPVSLILPRKLSWIMLTLGASFHAANAVVMGLNKFFWAFVAAYPAVLWCRNRLDQ